MANYDNIKDKGFDSMDEAQRKETSTKGGLASGESRRRKKQMREEADALLALACKNKNGLKALEEIGKKKGNNQAAIIAAQMVKAMNGDMEALLFLRDILGEKPVEVSETNGTTRFMFEGIGNDITG